MKKILATLVLSTAAAVFLATAVLGGEPIVKIVPPPGPPADEKVAVRMHGEWGIVSVVPDSGVPAPAAAEAVNAEAPAPPPRVKPRDRIKEDFEEPEEFLEVKMGRKTMRLMADEAPPPKNKKADEAAFLFVIAMILIAVMTLSLLGLGVGTNAKN